MKKQLLSRISFALVICALFGMTGCGNVPQTIPDTTSDKPTTTEPTTTEPTWKSIEYNRYLAVCLFDAVRIHRALYVL